MEGESEVAMNRYAAASTPVLGHPELIEREPTMFQATLEPVHPGEVAGALFMMWLASSPAWLLAYAVLAG
jgi:hypothetical protein